MGGISLKFAILETRRESGTKIHTSRSKSSKTSENDLGKEDEQGLC